MATHFLHPIILLVGANRYDAIVLLAQVNYGANSSGVVKKSTGVMKLKLM